jgi:hypothetical protein
MKKLLCGVAIAALLVGPSLATVTIVQKPVALPGGGTTPFDFANDGTNSWYLFGLFDGNTTATFNPNGQASANNSQPVVLPAAQVGQDPCSLNRKTTVAISFTAANIQPVPPVVLQQVFICAIFLKPSGVDTISIIGGLGPACATGTPVALTGSVTPSAGVDMSGLGDGWARGDGSATVEGTITPGHGVCITHTGTGKVAGSLEYVQQQ